MTPIRRQFPTAGLPLFLVAVILVAGALSAQAGNWKGSEENRDGVLHILNPAEAIDPPMTIPLEESFRLGGWDGGDDEFFGVIADIMEDEDGNLYVLDAQLNEIKIYDAEGNYLDSIGREGEGPGEFRGANSLFWMPNGDIGVIQVFPGRIVTLTKDGQPGTDYKLEELEGAGFRILFGAERAGDNLAIIYGTNKFDQANGEWSQRRTLAYFDATGKEIAQLHYADMATNMNAPVITEAGFDNFSNRWLTDASGRAFAADDLNAYEILVWDPAGKKDRVIEREYEALPRTAEEKEEILEIYKGFTRQIPAPNKRYEVNDNHPVVNWRGLHARPDGSLWVATSRGSNDAPDDQLGTYDIFDPKGRFVRQALLEGQCDSQNDAVLFVGDRIFVITEFLNSAMAAQGGGTDTEEEGEAEPMTLICYKSDLLDKAAGIPKGSGDSR